MSKKKKQSTWKEKKETKKNIKKQKPKKTLLSTINKLSQRFCNISNYFVFRIWNISGFVRNTDFLEMPFDGVSWRTKFYWQYTSPVAFHAKPHLWQQKIWL